MITIEITSDERNCMKLNRIAFLVLLIMIPAVAAAQKHEVAFTAGAIKSGDRTLILPPVGSLITKTGLTYQFNYANRIVDAKLVGVYLEFPLVITPKRDVESSNPLAPKSYSSLFIAPGIKVKAFPIGTASPYVFAGVGYGRFGQSEFRLDDSPITGSRSTNRHAFDIGGGLDMKAAPFLSIRLELRDFVSGVPKFDVTKADGQQHNVLFSGGIVLRF
jgi:opacity protein-like surface antigen